MNSGLGDLIESYTDYYGRNIEVYERDDDFNSQKVSNKAFKAVLGDTKAVKEQYIQFIKNDADLKNIIGERFPEFDVKVKFAPNYRTLTAYILNNWSFFTYVHRIEIIAKRRVKLVKFRDKIVDQSVTDKLDVKFHVEQDLIWHQFIQDSLVEKGNRRTRMFEKTTRLKSSDVNIWSAHAIRKKLWDYISPHEHDIVAQFCKEYGITDSSVYVGNKLLTISSNFATPLIYCFSSNGTKVAYEICLNMTNTFLVESSLGNDLYSVKQMRPEYEVFFVKV